MSEVGTTSMLQIHMAYIKYDSSRDEELELWTVKMENRSRRNHLLGLYSTTRKAGPSNMQQRVAGVYKHDCFMSVHMYE